LPFSSPETNEYYWKNSTKADKPNEKRNEKPIRENTCIWYHRRIDIGRNNWPMIRIEGNKQVQSQKKEEKA
jgi:hypothetical protein